MADKTEIKKEDVKAVSGGCSGATNACPSCGSTNITTASDESTGLSHLYCFACGYEWNFNK